jgi:hypothetical protein
MSCTLTSRDRVKALVFAVLRANGFNVDESTEIARDLGIDDDQARTQLFHLISGSVELQGCSLKTLTAGDLAGIVTIGDLIDAITNEL